MDKKYRAKEANYAFLEQMLFVVRCGGSRP